ncbi:hypothetical protein K9L67_01705 [Candidatus Woesearchaeota archaeon]|nr:hypothetical protein [Candidatus Woesearchaeota archaeon]MCF7900919.1 hypothetical protein [Candidatus Woesearchaeota archaeon]MCF8013033.1 hypothetical protein [Candidatus Woesearchaeota archaeon]
MKTKKIINYLKNNLNKENIGSMFLAGSQPEYLDMKKDIDVFFIMKRGRENEFLDDLTSRSETLVSSSKDMTYSFFRGPLKFSDKGLVHYIIYSEKPLKHEKSSDAFVNEAKQVLKCAGVKNTLIFGRTPSDYLIDVDLNDRNVLRKESDKFRTKYESFLENNFIEFGEWVKNSGAWSFERSRIYPDNFQKRYLKKYFLKNM